MTYKEIRKNEEVRAYLKKGNENLVVLVILTTQKYTVCWLQNAPLIF